MPWKRPFFGHLLGWHLIEPSPCLIGANLDCSSINFLRVKHTARADSADDCKDKCKDVRPCITRIRRRREDMHAPRKVQTLLSQLANRPNRQEPCFPCLFCSLLSRSPLTCIVRPTSFECTYVSSAFYIA